jgi:hypothetical protein
MHLTQTRPDTGNPALSVTMTQLLPVGCCINVENPHFPSHFSLSLQYSCGLLLQNVGSNEEAQCGFEKAEHNLAKTPIPVQRRCYSIGCLGPQGGVEAELFKPVHTAPHPHIKPLWLLTGLQVYAGSCFRNFERLFLISSEFDRIGS